MHKIKVPYIPVDRFDESEILERFSEAPQEEDNYEIESFNSEKLPEEMALILYGMGMEKYAKHFKKDEMSIATFLQLNESDLEEIGITNKEDRTFIAKNLSFFKTNTKKFVISENHMEDLQIIKNLTHLLLLLKHYCTYCKSKMKKQKLVDFIMNSNESACNYLEAFAGSALIQSQILSFRVYDVNGSEALTNKILKAYSLTWPKTLLELLPKKKKKRSKIFKIMIVISFSSFFIITGKYLIKKW